MTGAAAPWGRRALLVAAAGSALVAVLAGLGRVGLAVPLAERAMDHGPLFVLGTFVTVISLERAVALAAPWALAAPASSALGALLTLAHLPGGAGAFVAASALLAVANGAIVRRQPLPFTWLMLLGSLSLALGTLAWALGRAVFEVVPAWLAFFVLTILAERLELSRLAPTPRWASRLCVVLAVLHALAAGATCLAVPSGARPLGATLVLLGLWQLRFDLARRTITRPGLPRFTALGVLLGIGWTIAAGLLLLRGGLPSAGPAYDAVLHALLVGFVLSMVFAHAPIILPAVARIALPFHPALYVPLAVLHVGLLLRVAGDLAGEPALRQAGAASHAAALVLFVLSVLGARVATSARAGS